MRFAATVSFAAAASAFVVPNVKDAGAWADFLPSLENVEESVGDLASKLRKDWDIFSNDVESALHSAGDSVSSTVQSLLGDDEELDIFGGHHHRHRHPHKKHENKTIYEQIKESDYTKKFAALVDEHEDIVKLLNSTKANYTLFVPIDAAFEHIPDHPDHKPSKEFVEAVLRYHVGVGVYPAGRILATHTIPTALDEDRLDGEAQRLRVRVGLTGVRVNFYNKVVGANSFAKNGVVHAVRYLLVPPPPAGKLLGIVPSKFSTVLLAAQKTDFAKYVKGLGYPLHRVTMFAPSNTAFDRLGPGANAFLFNTEKGLRYLKALLKYHVVVNSTLYSDAFYQTKPDGSSVSLFDAEDEVEEQGLRHYHVDLESLLDGKNIAVDISRWGGFIDVKVNGYVHVAVQDVIAKDGSIQVVNNVLLPHRKPGQHEAAVGEISVEELVERLQPYVEDEEEQSEWTDL